MARIDALHLGSHVLASACGECHCVRNCYRLEIVHCPKDAGCDIGHICRNDDSHHRLSFQRMGEYRHLNDDAVLQQRRERKLGRVCTEFNFKRLHLVRLLSRRPALPGWVLIVSVGSLMLVGCSAGTVSSGISPTSTAVTGNQYEYDLAVKTAKCLTDKGWEVEVDPQGGWGVVAGVPEAQADVYRDDYVACTDSLGLNDLKVTEESAKRTFENNVRVTECLTSEGYSIPETPSEKKFVSGTLEDPQTNLWDPYLLVPENELGAAVTACPQ